MIEALYAEVRERMRVGDVIAFGGKGRFSSIIKRFTRYPVSHVGIVLQRVVRGDSDGSGFFNEIIESTSLQGFSGVITRQVSRALEDYDGDVWWLPLKVEARASLDVEAFTRSLLDTRGRPYDMRQAIGSAIDGIVPDQQEDFARFFCSELVVYGLRAGGVVPASFNPSELTPADVCRLDVWAEPVQLKGHGPELPGLGLYLALA